MNRVNTLTIVSGGQTGADRAALDFAIEYGLAHDGWCPRGRLAEDGPLDERYQLRETPSRKYAQRTEWNVRDSEATVVFSMAREVEGGTALTIAVARRLGKPWLHLAGEDFAEGAAAVRAADQLNSFLVEHDIHRLNVAGPRASQEPDIAAFVHHVCRVALDRG